jgi:hypothetical protein
MRRDLKSQVIKFRRQILILLTVVFLLSGCAGTVSLQPTVNRPPNITRLPLTVGIYYRQSFRTHQYVHKGLGDSVFPLGQANVDLFDKVFAMLFEKVRPVQNWPRVTNDKPAAVIESKVEEFILMDFKRSALCISEITYRFTLYSHEKTLVTWTLTGVGVKKHGFFACESDSGATELAMQDAARNFLTVFQGIPEVRQWLRSSGIL